MSLVLILTRTDTKTARLEDTEPASRIDHITEIGHLGAVEVQSGIEGELLLEEATVTCQVDLHEDVREVQIGTDHGTGLLIEGMAGDDVIVVVAGLEVLHDAALQGDPRHDALLLDIPLPGVTIGVSELDLLEETIVAICGSFTQWQNTRK
jgi:hypothetical protein